MRLGYLDQINSSYPTCAQPCVPADSVLGSHEAFEYFNYWLYNGVLPHDNIRPRLPALWNLASSFDVPEFENYLVDWCRKHLQTPPEICAALRDLAYSETPWPDLPGLFPSIPTQALPAYLLEKVAYEILKSGGPGFF